MNYTDKDNELLSKIWDFHYYSDQARASFMNRYIASFKMYYNVGLTNLEKKIIQERGQSEISLPILRNLTRRFQSFMTSQTPQWQAFADAFSEESYSASQMTNAYLGHTYRISDGYEQVSNCILQTVIGGVGIFYAYTDFLRNPKGDVKFESFPIRFWYPDWRSRLPNFHDMRKYQISFPVHIDDAIRIAPKHKKKLMDMSHSKEQYDNVFSKDNLSFGDFSDPEENDKYLRYVGHFELEEGDVFDYRDLIDDQVVTLSEESTVSLPYTVKVQKRTIPRLVRYDCFYGDQDGVVYNIEKYPFAENVVSPFMTEAMGNPYSVGEMFFVSGLSKYLDKAVRTMLQRESLAANPGTYLPAGATNDIETLRKRTVIPGFTEEIDMSKGVPIFKNPITTQAPFGDFIRILFQTIEGSFGNMFTPDMSQGNAKEALLMIEQGQEMGNMMFRSFISSFERISKSLIKLGIHHHKDRMVLRFLNERNMPTSMMVNVSSVNDRGEIVSQMLHQMDEEITVTAIAKKTKALQINRITEIMQYAPEQYHDLLFMELMKLMDFDLDIVREAQQRSQLIPQLMQQIQQMAQQIEELSKITGQQETQLRAADRAIAREHAQAEVDSRISKLRADFDMTLNQLKLAQQKASMKKETSNAKK